MEKERNVFINKWKKQQYHLLKANFPNASKEEIYDFLDEQIKENLKNPKGILMNSYVNKGVSVSLLDLIDFIENTKPIIAGNGTLYNNQNIEPNPRADVLDGFLNKRKEYKAKLKIYDPSSYEYATYDRLQKGEKINANSDYGASGNEGYIFYNLFCAVSTTATAQSLISTTETAFENFLSNNNPYLNLDDFNRTIINIRQDKYTKDTSLLPNKTIEEVYDRYINNFKFTVDDFTRESVFNILSSCSQEELNKIYYKSNIYDFFDIPLIHDKLAKILGKVKTFVNPNDVPKNIQNEIEDLWSYVEEFVMYKHFAYNRISRLKFEPRKSVVVVDTDSNMLNLDPWVNFIAKNFYSKEPETIGDKTEEEALYASINVMSYFITQMVNRILEVYTKRSNILKEYRPRINMKNEFLYLKMILSKVKKRYSGCIRLREGVELIPEKIDIKGHEFVKAECPAPVKEYMTNVVKNRLLYSDTISLSNILSDISNLENIIGESLSKGEMCFLLPKQVKTMEFYKNPLSVHQFKATLCWNLIYPELEIDLPSNVYLVKLTLGSKFKLEELSQAYPDIYDKIYERILNEGSGMTKLESIALPPNVKEVPQWILDFMDIEEMVNDSVSKFYSVLEALNIPTVKAKASKVFFSNILLT